DGEIVWKPDTDYTYNRSGYVIHGAIHGARPDVGAIIHTHTRAGMAVSAQKRGLLPLTQTSMRFIGHIAYHDYEGPAINKAEQARLIADLGPHNSMILKNHGLLTCGPTVPEAFNLMYQLENSCKAQIDALTSEVIVPDDDVVRHTANQYQPGTRRPYGILEWPAMLRRLQYEQDGFPPYDS
ncbi:MAG: class II aldolase/adducin family protein, partial [Dehalococcoidia bacterium]